MLCTGQSATHVRQLRYDRHADQVAGGNARI